MTSLITVTNGEHEYIREWIEYHLNIGVELICIGFNGPTQQFDFMPRYDKVKYFDFSYNDQCRISKSLKVNENEFTEFDNIDSHYNKSVSEMKPLQKMHNIMIDTLEYLYPGIKFCAVIDVDEFLVINNSNYVNNIDKLLVEKFPDWHSSYFVSRIYYGDNNLIEYEDKPVMERFFDLDNYCDCGWENNLNNHNKIIINLWHKDTKDNKCKMLSKYHCGLSSTKYKLLMRDLECANFFTKSFEEYIKKWSTKQNRRNMLSNYFKYVNEMTDEKFKALPELLNKYNITDYNLLRDEENKELRNTYKKFLENQ